MKFKYRPEIDGLRAVSVISVILYHAQIKFNENLFFKGGFIGVDIFFVISGYLITSIILNEYYSKGYFSIIDFYQRRIRRIIPPLLFVITISIPFAWLYLLPVELIDYSKSILHSLGFISNYYFYFADIEYGSLDSFLKPFLHTWSLSIEEQFYIIFPILILIIFKYLRSYWFYIFIIFFFVNLFYSNFNSKLHSSQNFYLITGRIWELILGSLLSFLHLKLKRYEENQFVNNIFIFIALCLISYAIFTYDDTMRHPSIHTLLPLTGVSFFILFSTENNPFLKIFSSKLFVTIGLLSYSLYLWHFPIFSFSRIIEFTQGDIYKKLFLIFLITLFSVISYLFIEKPSRNKKNKFKYVIFPIIIFYIIIIFINLKFISKNGYLERFPKIINQNYLEEPWNLLKNENGEICFNKKDGCTFNSPANKKIYLIGDSHMASIMNDLKNKTTKEDYRFIALTNQACYYFPNFDLITLENNKTDKNCTKKYFKYLENIFLKEENATIIFGGRLSLYLTNKYFNNQEGGAERSNLIWEGKYFSKDENYTINETFKNSIKKISKKNNVILIYPIPEVGWHLPRKLTNKIRKNNNKNLISISEYITTSYEVYISRNKKSFDLLDSVNNQNIYRIYPHKLFCDTAIENRCLTHDNKNIYYYDYDHLSAYGASLVNKEIMKIINKINK